MTEFHPYERILVLALDSVAWDLLLPFAADGTMPALQAFLRTANYGVLDSTVPPHTAAAWTTFLTGQDPGHHGVIDFVRFDPHQHRFHFHESSVHNARNMLTRLSETGVSCGSIFLPRNYPPYPLPGGYMISGFETPNTKCRFTEPQDLRAEVLDISPQLHFNFEDDWEKEDSDQAFDRNLKRAIAAVDVLESLTVHLQRERPVRLQISYLQATDILFHKAWKWCDPNAVTNKLRHDLVKRFFRRVDQLLNRTLGVHASSGTSQRFRSAPQRVLRLICSDHGHGDSKGRVYINNLLQDWGFLTPLSGWLSAARRIRMLAHSAAARRELSRELPLDWARTRAYLAHVGIYGFVYINLKGREAGGSVPPESFEAVRNELRDKFLAEKIPETGQPLFVQVLKGEDVYARKKELNLPDLIVAPSPGFFPRAKLVRGPAVRLTSKGIGGTHRPEGVYAFSGPDIVASNGLGVRANIADLAPTLFAALGQPVPAEMTGKPLLHIFKNPPAVAYLDAPRISGRRKSKVARPTYSKEEEQALEKRLSDLGYLE